MLGEIALWSFVVLLLTGVFLTLWFVPEHGRDRVPGLLRPAARRPHVRGLRVLAQPVVRRPRWPAHAADAPLGRDDLHRLDDDPPAPSVLHRRVPQAARAQLGHRLPAAVPRHARGLHRLLAARRLAVRHRRPCCRRLHEGQPGRRHLHVVLPLRWRVPGRVDHPAPLHRARAADPGSPAGPDRRPHAAARLPQAHAVARARPHRGERRRVPDAPRLHGQGRRVLLHRLRCHRSHGWPAVDQPGVEVRPLRPDQGHGWFSTRLVHGVARRPASHHPRLGVGHRRLHDLVEHPDPDPDPAAADADGPDHAAVHRRLDHRRQAGAPPARAACGTPRRAPQSWSR